MSIKCLKIFRVVCNVNSVLKFKSKFKFTIKFELIFFRVCNFDCKGLIFFIFFRQVLCVDSRHHGGWFAADFHGGTCLDQLSKKWKFKINYNFIWINIKLLLNYSHHHNLFDAGTNHRTLKNKWFYLPLRLYLVPLAPGIRRFHLRNPLDRYRFLSDPVVS